MLIKILATAIILYFVWVTLNYLLRQISPLLIGMFGLFVILIVLVWLPEMLKLFRSNFNTLAIYNSENLSLAVLIFGLSILLTLKLLGSLRGQSRQLTNLTRQIAIQNAVETK